MDSEEQSDTNLPIERMANEKIVDSNISDKKTSKAAKRNPKLLKNLETTNMLSVLQGDNPIAFEIVARLDTEEQDIMTHLNENKVRKKMKLDEEKKRF